jgi:hypothetical protein
MAWELTGNGGTDPATNFLGTTDNEPLIIKTNEAEHLRVDAAGNVSIPAGNLSIGVDSGISEHPASPNVETTEILRLTRPAQQTIKNSNSMGLFVGAFKPGINGRSRLDINVSGTPGDSNGWGGIPDVTVMTLQGNGSIGIGTTNPQPYNVLDVETTDNRTAVSGLTHDGIGVSGISSTNYGVAGTSSSKDYAGVHGSNTDLKGIGVLGDTFNGIGVQGRSTNGNGVFGSNAGDVGAGVTGITSPQPNTRGFGTGVYGQSTGGAGVSGFSQNGYGVSGYSSNNWSGYFGGIDAGTQGVYITVPAGQPGLQVASGTKNAVVATSQGTRALHTEESTAVWFTDYGFAHLQAGRTVITIDPLFAETVNLSESYHVLASQCHFDEKVRRAI